MGVIISNNRQNLASPLIIIMPITSLKAGDKIYSFEVETFINNQAGKILVDQITTTNKLKRVGKFVGRLDEKLFVN
jgi:mRNA-degrading endonuclease toxin of MazEF toxin-antitoxin module